MHSGKAKIGARILPGFGDIGLDKNRPPKSKIGARIVAGAEN